MPDVRRGNQRPRLSNVPQGVSSDGADAVELAALCGLFLDPWQQYVLDCLLQRRADRRWVTKNGLVVVPRQNGKGAVDEAWELHRLFIMNVPEVLHTAHHNKTAKDAFKKMRFRIESSPLLRGRLMPDRSGGIRVANGEYGFTFKTGQRLTYSTRTAGAGRGETIPDIVIDEVQELTDTELDALSSTSATKPFGQFLMTGSAPIPGKSEVLTRLIQAGRTADPSLTYLEWSLDENEPVDLDDREMWAQANPGYGIRIFDEEIMAERARQSPEGFARERLGIVAVGAGGLFPAKSWDALADLNSELVSVPTFAIAVAEDHSWSCIAASGQSRVGDHVEVVDYRPNTGWVVNRAVDLLTKNGAATFVVRPGSAAGSLIGDLENANVPVTKAAQQDYAQACGNLYDAVIGAEIRHLAQGELDTSVAGAAKRLSGDAFAWDQRKSGLDISPLEAVTLAYWGHVVHTPAAPNIW
jgi:hypothetical protein